MTVTIADSVAPHAGATLLGPEPRLRPRTARPGHGQGLRRPPQATAGGCAVSSAVST